MKEYTPDYVERCQLDHYCKLVLYHEAIDYLREMQRYRNRQTSLEDISPAQWDKLSTLDEYPSDSFKFSAFGYDLHIRDELVAGAFASLPVIIQLIKICGLPVERYFNPEIMREESAQRQRVSHKLKLCPEEFLPIIEGAIDGAIQIQQKNDETEGA